MTAQARWLMTYATLCLAVVLACVAWFATAPPGVKPFALATMFGAIAAINWVVAFRTPAGRRARWWFSPTCQTLIAMGFLVQGLGVFH